MKNRLSRWPALIAVALLFAAAPASAAVGKVSGRWTGFWSPENGSRESVAIEFDDESGTEGRFTAPAAMEFSKATLDKEAGSIVLEATDTKSGKQYRFEGQVDDNEIQGTMKIGDVEGEIRVTTSFMKWIELTALATWIRQSPSPYAYAGILLLHTTGMALVFGLSAAISLRMLGLAREIPLAPLRRFFPILWLGFWLNAVTGSLLLYADITKLVPMPDFWAKMTFIALAIVNLRLIKTRVFADPAIDQKPLGAHVKVLGLTLIIFWVGAVVAGRLIAYLKTTG